MLLSSTAPYPEMLHVVTGKIGAAHLILFKRIESHKQVDANTKAQVGISWTAMAATLSRGRGFAEGEASLARAPEEMRHSKERRLL